MNIQAIIFDMDGVLYHGDCVIATALDFVQSTRHIPHCFITNNPILPSSAIAKKLQNMGFEGIKKQQIITSAQATAQWLSQQKPNFRFFSVGAEGLKHTLQQYGHYDETHADYVVVGEGAGINFEQITLGINLIAQGAQLISTNPDQTVDAVRNGKRIILPGGGALVAPFECASDCRAITIGKPYPLLYQMALHYLQVSEKQCLMIGDRPDTDIKGAAALSMPTALVRTGRFYAGQALPSDCPKPTWDVENLTELLPKIIKKSP